MSDARIVPRFARAGFGPGEAVEGVFEVVEPMDKLRRLDAYLRYIDRSPDYADAVTGAAAEPLHEGPVEVGRQIPFSLTLPADALPSWQHPATDEMGTLTWAIVTESDIARGLDKTTTHAVPVADGTAGWRGPEPVADGEVEASGGKWDVEIAPDRWSLRRGEGLAVTVEIGKPEAGRDSLEIRLMCRCGYDVEVTSTDSDGDTTHRRETRWATMFDGPAQLDPSSQQQTVEFAVPVDGPFTYDGNAFCFRWFVVAKEARRLRSDPHRSARLLVLP